MNRRTIARCVAVVIVLAVAAALPTSAAAKPALWSKTSDYTRVWLTSGCGYEPCVADATADPMTGAAHVDGQTGPDFGWAQSEVEFIEQTASLPEPMPFVWIVATLHVDAVSDVVGTGSEASADVGLRLEAFLDGCDLCWQRTFLPLASSESGQEPARSEFHGDIVLPLLFYGNVGGDLPTDPMTIIVSLVGAAGGEGDEPRQTASFDATMQLQRLELVAPKYAKETGPNRGGNITLTATPPWTSFDAYAECGGASCPQSTVDAQTGALDLHAFSSGTAPSSRASTNAYLNHEFEVPTAFDSILIRYKVHYEEASVAATGDDSGSASTMFGADHAGCSFVQTCYSFDQMDIVRGPDSQMAPDAIYDTEIVYELLFRERQREGQNPYGGPMAAGTLTLVSDFFLDADATVAPGLLSLLPGSGDGEDAHTTVRGTITSIEMVIHPIPWPQPYEETVKDPGPD